MPPRLVACKTRSSLFVLNVLTCHVDCNLFLYLQPSYVSKEKTSTYYRLRDHSNITGGWFFLLSVHKQWVGELE